MESGFSKALKRTARMHSLLLALVCLIASIGFVLLYGAAGGMDPYAFKQIIRFIVGLILMWAVAITPIKVWANYAYIFYMIALVLLVWVVAAGQMGMGAQRWIDLKVFVLQPSELAKVTLILALAHFYHNRSTMAIHTAKNMAVPLMLIGIMFGMVVIQPDLGTALVLAFIGAALMFNAGVMRKFFVGCFALGVAIVPIAWAFLLKDYQKKRLLTFMNPEADPLGSGYHIMQSKIALGSSDLWGKGFMQGTQSRLEFLPEKHTDFIFTLLVEDFGLFGAGILLGAYMLLVIVGMRIAYRSSHLFGKLVASGVTMMIFLHALINMSMVMGLMPVVGLPLPLVSYGGSSMLTMMFAIGLMMNVHIHRDHTVPGGVNRFSFR